MNFETRTKLNCQISSLGKMCRLSRQTDRNYPTSPRSLEDLILPPEYIHAFTGYRLLPCKIQALHSSLLDTLDSFGPYDPQSVLCDHEFALHNAITHTWPSATVRRRMLREDLVPEYEVENSPIRKAFKLIIALPSLKT
ncbi:hypothetical protein ACHWQZ_G013429 [Mnemiopsis leidyi]